MTAQFSEVIFDTNVFAGLYDINGDLDLFQLICDSYGGKPICDEIQFGIINYLPDFEGHLFFHDATDEEVALFVIGYPNPQHLQKLMQDPTDLRLLVYAIRVGNIKLLTSDRRLLVLGNEQKVSSSCFKAAIHHLHEQLGNLFTDNTYQIEDMFLPNGPHPFFHYKNSKYCSQCDPQVHCPTRNVTDII